MSGHFLLRAVAAGILGNVSEVKFGSLVSLIRSLGLSGLGGRDFRKAERNFAFIGIAERFGYFFATGFSFATKNVGGLSKLFVHASHYLVDSSHLFFEIVLRSVESLIRIDGYVLAERHVRPAGLERLVFSLFEFRHIGKR